MKISLPVYFLLFWNTLAWSWRISLSLFLSLLLHFTRIGKTRHKRQYSPALSQRSRHLKNPFPSSLMLTFVCTHTHPWAFVCLCKLSWASNFKGNKIHTSVRKVSVSAETECSATCVYLVSAWHSVYFAYRNRNWTFGPGY